MTAARERRKFPRMPAECPVRYRAIPADDHPSYQGALVRDVSPGGLRFRTFSYVPLGAHLLLELQLPAGPPIRAAGKATWVRALANDDGYEVGGEFDVPVTPLRSALSSRSFRADATHPGFLL